MKNYKGYPLFNETTNRKLRAFNRLQTMMNINEAMGRQMAENYAEELDQKGRADVLLMGTLVEKFGMEEVKATMNKEGK